ncbi:hypothetical protein HK097_001517 [Rhizophlyctis rosea]|uniref:Endoplasmic reticulum junction formation protein lunapark n=1 Tax=Rhizophlyctis rosea TaxID=64517 RepID=A0AAD5X6D6_9FUNG|nr:hypothetical protein HK097_001517 [Rhizophlyctis rosea]
MVGIFNLFKKKEEEDWEKLLADFDAKIRKAEVRISDLGVRERRVLYAFLLYSVPIYGFYLLIYFTFFRTNTEDWQLWLAKTSPVIIGPPLLYTIRRFVRYYYTNKRRHEVVELENLKVKQKEKVEELKKKTAYYTTKGLIERYDVPPGGAKQGSQTPKKPQQGPLNPNGPRGSSPGQQQQFQPPQQHAGPHQQQQRQGGSPQQGQPPFGGNVNAPPQLEQRRSEVTMSPPAQKGWLDKVVDVMIGDSDGPQSKYALICEECFKHNGLVPPEAYSTAKFRCMQCNHLNAPKNYKNLGLQSSTGDLFAGHDDDHLTPTPAPRIRNASAPEVLLRGQTVGNEHGAPLGGDASDGGIGNEVLVVPLQPYELPVPPGDGVLESADGAELLQVPLEVEGLRNRRAGGASELEAEEEEQNL